MSVHANTPCPRSPKAFSSSRWVVLPGRFRHEQGRETLSVAVVGAVPGTLEQRPHAFDGVGVNDAAHVLHRVVDGQVGQEALHGVVGLVFVRNQQGPVGDDRTAEKIEDGTTL